MVYTYDNPPLANKGSNNGPDWKWWSYFLKICAGVLLLFIFLQTCKLVCKRGADPNPTPIVSENVIKDSVSAAKERHDYFVDSISVVNEQLRATADSAKAVLFLVKKSEAILKDRIAKWSKSTSLRIVNNARKSENIAIPVPDSTKDIGQVDTYNAAQDYINEYAKLFQQQDSTCGVAIGALEAMVSNKDAELTAKDRFNAALKRQLDVSLDGQKALSFDNKGLRSRLRWVKVERTILRTVVVAFLLKAGYDLLKK